MEDMKKRLVWGGGMVLIGLASVLFLYIVLPRPLSRLPLVQFLLPTYRSFIKIADIPYLWYLISNEEFPVYGFVIDGKDLAELNNALPSDPFEGRLTEEFKEAKISALFTASDYAAPVDVRYRGFNPGHWTTKKKSWRVEFPEDNLFRGHEVLNFVIPSDRHWIGTVVAQYRAHKLGIEIPETYFVNLKVNNEEMGLYLIEAGWTKRFLERHRMPTEGAYLYSTKDVDQQSTILLDIRSLGYYWYEQLSEDEQKLEKLEEFFRAYAKSGKVFEDAMYALLDIEGYSRLVALNVLSANTTELINMRLYYNPHTRRFSIIPSPEISIYCQEGHMDNLAQVGFLEKLTELPAVKIRVSDIVRSYIADEKNLEDDLAFFDSTWNAIKGDIFRDQAKAVINYQVEQEIFSMRSCIIDSFEKASLVLPPE